MIQRYFSYIEHASYGLMLSRWPTDGSENGFFESSRMWESGVGDFQKENGFK